ncbi:hypothetical protein GJ688_00420 [Heliobacillus mobilis]|uniref:Uncharacterized protein n=1 Tax=Heliobacterium mobile TaxID=28064 RepID=A0A6I3SF05_HELMO|nr:hypothetical protein [Heliobacterium mobile]
MRWDAPEGVRLDLVRDMRLVAIQERTGMELSLALVEVAHRVSGTVVDRGLVRETEILQVKGVG